LFVQFIPTLATANPAVPLKPPSWMNGVEGQDIELRSTVISNCITSSGGAGDLWGQFWNFNGNSMEYGIGCVPSGQQTYGFLELETPGSSYCVNTGYENNGIWYCQLPFFTNSNSGYGSVTYSGVTACGNVNCYKLLSSGSSWSGTSIVHNQVDTNIVDSQSYDWFAVTYQSSS
jgi:hypothetical protein